MKKLIATLFLSALLPSASMAQAPDAAAGKTLWEGNGTQCRNCHGRTGEGGFGPDLAGRGLSAPQFQQAVRHPWGVMPTFIDSQVTDAELASMTTYLNGLPRNATPAAWNAPIDPATPHGQQLLANYGCAQCHGATFNMARASLGGTNADFATFRDLVYKHTDTIHEFEESMRGPAPAAPPGGGRGGAAPRIRMGNFTPMRVPESELKQIYDWARSEIGFRPAIQARLAGTGATYALTLTNGGIKGKGLTANRLTVALAIPAGVTVVSATGDGYKGVRADATLKSDVAEWQLPRLAPKDSVALSITLSRPATTAEGFKGTARWATPGPKSGPNLDVVNIMQMGGPPPG